MQKLVLVIHGGAGVIKNLSDERAAAYKERLTASLQAGYKVLQEGKSSIEAVTAAIMVMEDSELFNCGKGSVYTNLETIEMDASIMCGNSRKAGAVCSVQTIKNPITAALAVMEKSEHVMLSAKGADDFARINGCEMVDVSYFQSENRLNQLKSIKAKEEELLHRDCKNAKEVVNVGTTAVEFEDPALNNAEQNKKFGTVGAVALDSQGNIAAGTSTGGMTNKRYGRIGDSPIIGAGTYASNETCAVSCTGHGEYFMRNVVAYDIAAVMNYKGVSLKEAAEYVIMEKLVQIEGSGGAICVDKHGNYAMPFNTPGMYRGVVTSEGVLEVSIYKNGHQ
jgi:beta-aspartyl-peptidase (threonine type)